MKNTLIAGGNGEEILTGERLYVRERLNDPSVPEVSLADCRVEPGVTTELHRLDVAEWYVIIDGSGLMEVGERKPFAVGPGDSVEIQRGVAQRITNTGDTDLLFQCVCLPRFTQECYRSLEEDKPGSE